MSFITKTTQTLIMKDAQVPLEYKHPTFIQLFRDAIFPLRIILL
jgi:hypothetical protein